MADDRDRLTELLGGPQLAWLRNRIRSRLEHGGTATGTVTLTGPSPDQRAAVDRLLGRRPSTGTRVTVPLGDLDRMLRAAQICDGLGAAVAILDGPIADVAGRRRATAAAWAELLDGAAGNDEPSWRVSWWDDLAATGLLRRLTGDPHDARWLLERAEAVLAALPAGGIGLARLAAATLHDSHALDADRPVATVVLKALQHQHLPSEERGPLPTGADRRALWAAAGVLLDELAAPVLLLGLPGGGGGLVDATLRAHAAAGEPVHLTLRQLLRHPPDLADVARRTVRVCENPAVVSAAADAVGPGCAPLVCTEGQPSSAVQTLLRMLRRAGADLTHHGDFDRGGLRIATTVVRRFGARPWRFDVASYRAAPSGLADAMNTRRVAVHEEQVIDDLLADLGRSD